MAPRSTDVATRSPAIALGVVLAVFALLPFAAGTRTPAAGAAPVVDNPHGKFREDCGECHGSAGWKPARITRKFDHSRYGFPLTGAHAASQCVSCHGSLDFTRQQKMCSNCHEDPHRGELGTACERCHNARSFIDRAPMLRAHQMSHFPLTGAHATLDCETCHTPVSQGKLRYVGTQVDCQGCHMPDYQAAKQPDHAAAAFPLECQQCHTPISWYTARFDHSRTRFPLTGAHVKTPCASCHGDGVYHGKSTDCYSCHKANYDATNDPPHAASGFGTTCATCHNTTSWAGAVFDHGATAFPLTGAHRTTPCLSCHGDGVYHGKSTDCYSCHKANYDATTDPKHSAAGFSTACATCHNTTNWSSGLFNHNATSFALTGAHVPLDCNRCHADNVFAAKSTDCYSCHKPSYDATTNPNHAAAAFPTACVSCHNTTTWAGATFDHDGPYFPIYSGTHLGRWTACTDCHPVASSFANFTCLSCHPHDDKPTTDGHHSGVNGYVYDSAHCYSCHPRGTH
jgi:hypothetical protein